MTIEIYERFAEDEKEYYGRLAFENKQQCLSKIELQKKVINRKALYNDFRSVRGDLLEKKSPTYTSYGDLTTSQQYTKEYDLYTEDRKVKVKQFTEKAKIPEYADDVEKYNNAIN